MEYLTDPAEIERRSMAIIDGLVPEPRPHAGDEWLVVRRMIHTTADMEMPSLVRFSPGAAAAGVAALASGGVIFTDTQMAKAGMTARRLGPLGCEVRCVMCEPAVADDAKERCVTRAVAAMDVAVAAAPRGVFAIGNAPTALLRLVEHMEAGRARPALVLGMPVGFVNAAESKDLLMRRAGDIPWIAIAGRKGGSALAAAAINALADLALARRGLAAAG